MNAFESKSEELLDNVYNVLDAQGGLIALFSEDRRYRYVVAADNSSTSTGSTRNSTSPDYQFIIEALQTSPSSIIPVETMPDGGLKTRIQNFGVTTLAIAPIKDDSNYLVGYIGVTWTKEQPAPSTFVVIDALQEASSELTREYVRIQNLPQNVQQP